MSDQIPGAAPSPDPATAAPAPPPAPLAEPAPAAGTPAPVPAAAPVATPPTPDVPAAGSPAPSEPAAATPETPPEYKEFVVPEGYTPTEEGLTAFKSWAAEQKLSQDQAQAFIHYDAARVADRQKHFDAAIEQQNQEWIETIKKDPVLGKDPTATRERVEAARKFFANDPDTIQFLKDSGWDKHPGFARLMYKAHDAIKHLTPDTFGPNGVGVGERKPLAQRLAPEMPNP